MSVTNGVPQQDSGVWNGAQNFDYGFAPGAVLPAGFTPFGQLAVDGVFATGVPEGTLPDGLIQALLIGPGTNNTNGGVGHDAFDAVWSGFGEIVALVYLPEADGRLSQGPSVGIGGVTQGTLKSEFAGMRQGNAVSIELATYEIINGGLGTVYGAGNVPGMENPGTGSFKWVRARWDDAGGGNTRFRAQSWDGAFGDDPGGYLRDNTAVLDLTGVIGISNRGMNTGADGEYDLAFFSFTEDPDTIPAPGPADIVDPATIPGASGLDIVEVRDFEVDMDTAPYSGPNPHATTTWQVTLAADTGFTAPVVDVTSAVFLEAYTATGLVPETDYIARAFFTDDQAGSGPATPVQPFTTLAIQGPTVVITEVQGTWATGEIDAVVPTPAPTPADFRTLTFADTGWDWIDGDFQIFANPAGGILTINLPDAADYIATGLFNPVHVKNIGSGLNEATEYVQVFGINGNTIDGFTDVINRLSQTNHTFVTDGINWYLQ